MAKKIVVQKKQINQDLKIDIEGIVGEIEAPRERRERTVPPSMYTGYDESHELLSMSDWYEFSAIKRWARMLIVMPFNVKANRDNIRTAFTQIQRVPEPFSRDVRFPNSYLVRMGAGEMMNVVMHILAALDLPDRAVNKDHASVDTSDAKRAYDVNVQRLITLVAIVSPDELSAHGVFGRRTFESKFNLIWN